MLFMYSRVTSPASWEEERRRRQRLYCPGSKGEPSEEGRDISGVEEPDKKSPLRTG